MKNKNGSRLRPALTLLLIIALGVMLYALSNPDALSKLRGGTSGETAQETDNAAASDDEGASYVASIDTSDLPEYDGNHYVYVNDNVPEFPDEVYESAGITVSGGKVSGDPQTFETYGELDKHGRCTYAYGCLGEETMPAEGEERGDISSIRPSGWKAGQEWERCHLIAWALSAENANEQNLITGTHYLNYEGMRPLEEEAEHYIWDTGNHVLYMSEPVFYGKESVARGVHMMAYSVEDGGKGLSFNVYCFNVTPGATIDYSTGIVTTGEQAAQDARLYVLNTRSGVFHYPTCEGAQSISDRNREEVTATRTEMIEQGYTPCGYCQP